ncbi:DNA gyrase subunit B [Kitasatospora cineracea]|uniref:DNA topoisomerase (ATP-hydrolyzing) n=1 Tax=Kitasatospora cineracea TaxID=88074 RepID=A0A3N4RYE0_9ACTN|nr:DNA gyrase subunit B [Kitasatospora cineracea]RPE35695.1 DNA gyrase subunit B [Kitasatospora cineracea]
MTEYNAAHIQVLEGPAIVRKRPGMYIGSTGARGLHQLLYEALEVAAEAVLLGRAGRIDVTLTADGGARVSHDGHPDASLPEQLTRFWAPPRQTGSRVHLSPFGTSLFTVSALSARLTVEEHRDGVIVRHAYARGEQLTPPTEAGATDRTGTSLTLHPDPEIFETVAFDHPTLADRLRELALLNREFDFTLTDERTTPPRTERLHHPAGPIDFTTHLGGDPTDTLTVLAEDARMGGTLDLALSWTGRGGVHCYANSRRTSDGTHLTGFREGLRAALLPRLGRHALRALLTELTAVVSIKLDDPNYEGCTREMLGNHPVHACTAEAVQHAVETWLAEHPQRAAELAGA